MFSEGIEVEHWLKMGLSALVVVDHFTKHV